MKAKRTWIAFGVLSAVIVGLTLYAVIMHEKTVGTEEHFSHNEKGFMDGSYIWETTDFPLRWTALRYQADGVTPRLTMAPLEVRRAADRWNAALGFRAFEQVEDGFRAQIIIDLGVPAEPGWMDPGGTAEIRMDNGPGHFVECRVRTSNTGTEEILFYVLVHELGHCLGLDHDTWDGSIMREKQFSAPDLRDAPRISDHDRALLRARYEDARRWLGDDW